MFIKALFFNKGYIFVVFFYFLSKYTDLVTKSNYSLFHFILILFVLISKTNRFCPIFGRQDFFYAKNLDLTLKTKTIFSTNSLKDPFWLMIPQNVLGTRIELVFLGWKPNVLTFRRTEQNVSQVCCISTRLRDLLNKPTF